jgi:hypothetical protein
VKNATRPAIFKWRQTAPELILCAVRWYLRYSLSLRDVEELFAERGLEADHTTVWRWVQRYGPELEQRLRRHLKPTNKSWRVDETVPTMAGTSGVAAGSQVTGRDAYVKLGRPLAQLGLCCPPGRNLAAFFSSARVCGDLWRYCF